MSPGFGRADDYHHLLDFPQPKKIKQYAVIIQKYDSFAINDYVGITFLDYYSILFNLFRLRKNQKMMIITGMSDPGYHLG